ncbi:MAG TPA: carbohydrate binding domain-containing protein [Pyrinomonadaceae bacterium]|nr:carbohydrate binding domain-containing protein [Pyrinomonadaceae bacterium]
MRSILAALTLLLFLCLMWSAGQAGYARSAADRGRETLQLALTERAVMLSPSDPETHYNRATLLWAFGDTEGAIREEERAASLRPLDYYLWFRLGFYQYHSDDPQGALPNFQKAISLAPYYAQPRWFAGNILLQMGRRDEAFDQLRRAAASDPTLLTGAIALVGEALGGDAKAIEQALEPKTYIERLALAHYFVEHGQTSEAILLFRAVDKLSEGDRRAFITKLLVNGRFGEAYEIWSQGRPGGGSNIEAVNNGGFEDELVRDSIGFTWQAMRDSNTLKVYLDPTSPRSGARSLRVDFNGVSQPDVPIISQIVLVKPKTSYRLSFSARTQDIASLGLPVVSLKDAGDNKIVLGQSSQFPIGTSGWQDYSLQFTTNDSTKAILIDVQRQLCETAPCPIYGHIWLDDFSLRATP